MLQYVGFYGEYAQKQYDQSEWEKGWSYHPLKVPQHQQQSKRPIPAELDNLSLIFLLFVYHSLQLTQPTHTSNGGKLYFHSVKQTAFGGKHVGLHGNDNNVSSVGETATSSRQAAAAAAAKPKPCARTFHFSRCKQPIS